MKLKAKSKLIVMQGCLILSRGFLSFLMEHQRIIGKMLQTTLFRRKELGNGTFPIAVEGADVDVLGQFALRDALQLEGIEFKKLFQWISASVRIGSQKADDNENVSLPPIDWTTV